jgi:hypothetical protein
MNRSLSRFLISIALMGAPLLAAAGPGMSVLDITVSPLNAAKVVAAFDKMMSSPLGEQFKGRLLLQAHVADGDNPATHSIVGLYHSMAEAEAFAAQAQNDPAWAELLNTVVPIAQAGFTARAATLKSWGDLNDTDTLWNVHYFAVTDPVAFGEALNAWLNSPTGKKFPGQGHLFALSAAGVNPATHIISVGYASMAEMEAYGDMVRNTEDWAKFMAALAPVSKHLGASILRDIKAWGPATVKSLSAQ